MKNSPITKLACTLTLLVASLGAVHAVKESAKEDNAKTCMSNQKQLALGFLMYAQDYDEKFPPANRWADGTTPYLKSKAVYNCPEVKEFGYAFSTAMSRKPLSKIAEPSKERLLFDSLILKKNAYGKEKDIDKRRHAEFGFIQAFVDGHVKRITPKTK